MRISDWSSDVCSSDLCNQPRYRHAALYRLIHAPYSIKIVATGSLLAAARRRHLGGRFAEPRQRCERIMELKILDALLLQFFGSRLEARIFLLSSSRLLLSTFASLMR